MDISVFREEKMLQKYNDDFIEYLPQIRKSASILAGKFGGTFAIDELINEAWIRGMHSNRPNKTQLISRATWDMKDYVRSLFGRNAEGSNKRCKRLNARANFLTLNGRPSFLTNADGAYDNGKVRNSVFDKGVVDKNLLSLENKELVKLILRTPSKSQLNTMHLYYFEGLTMKETGEKLGITESSVSNSIKSGIGSCRRRVELVDEIHEWQKKLGIANKEFAR
jgi:RNA polymerase sigma factor (sigma-70 family)